MKLLTKEIATKLKAAYEKSAADGGSADAEIIVKFFAPWGRSKWYITEGMPVDANGDPTEIETASDWHLFGFASIFGDHNDELGYVMLGNLKEIEGPFGLGIERDLHYHGHKLSEVM
jgi:hypothetical protein